MPSKTGKTEADVEWESRRLCSDESCIGVIGPDGRCKECGRAFEGELPRTSYFEAAETGAPTDVTAPKDDASGRRKGSTDDEWESRRLCSDESCIGVIGPDGRCKECGKLFDDPPEQ